MILTRLCTLRAAIILGIGAAPAHQNGQRASRVLSTPWRSSDETALSSAFRCCCGRVHVYANRPLVAYGPAEMHHRGRNAESAPTLAHPSLHWRSPRGLLIDLLVFVQPLPVPAIRSGDGALSRTFDRSMNLD